jgi:hypothetical protein
MGGRRNLVPIGKRRLVIRKGVSDRDANRRSNDPIRPDFRVLTNRFKTPPRPNSDGKYKIPSSAARENMDLSVVTLTQPPHQTFLGRIFPRLRKLVSHTVGSD